MNTDLMTKAARINAQQNKMWPQQNIIRHARIITYPKNQQSVRV